MGLEDRVTFATGKSLDDLALSMGVIRKEGMTDERLRQRVIRVMTGELIERSLFRFVINTDLPELSREIVD